MVLTLVFKCSPFGLQKESFYSPKGVLLAFKRSPFASQKGYICRAMPFGWPKHSIYYVQSYAKNVDIVLFACDYFALQE